MEDNSKSLEILKGISSISKNENNSIESVSQNFYSEHLDKSQPNKKPKEDIDSNDSKSINLTSRSLSNIIEEMINKLLEFSEALKSEIETNLNETVEEIKDEENSKIKKIYSVINNYNIEINECFSDIKNKFKGIESLHSTEEINIKDKNQSFKSNITNKISSIGSNHIDNINNESKSFVENINTINEIHEEGTKNKNILDKNTLLFIKEKNIFLLEEIKKFLDNENEKEKLKSQNSSNTSNSGSTNETVIKEDKTIFEVISELFKAKKYELAKELLKYLDNFGITEEYQGEIFHNFNSKIKKLYDSKKDGDNLLILMPKALGKKNLVTFFSVSFKDETITQLAFFKGKLDLIDNNFSFNNSELIIYGDYRDIDKNNSFTYFKSQNSRIYIKIDIDNIYIIFYQQENISFVAKIKNNFIQNPLEFLNEDEYILEDLIEKNSEDKVSELFNIIDKTVELKFNELVIYEMFE